MRENLKLLCDICDATDSAAMRSYRNEYRKKYKQNIINAKISMNNRIIRESNYSSRVMWNVVVVNAYRKNSNTVVADFDPNEANHFFISHPRDVTETVTEGSPDAYTYLNTINCVGCCFSLDLVSLFIGSGQSSSSERCD
ncbi:hypothetical protein QE152_g37257 [Popillia japonica]|uniref:Uncharacterized protein n=1 Tax=Popillia japonica TaxID=7064 RepID=A0AAW1IB39_POPJA